MASLLQALLFATPTRLIHKNFNLSFYFIFTIINSFFLINKLCGLLTPFYSSLTFHFA